MRRFLLLLLIALLPLRAWAGDVMALAAVPSAGAAVTVAAILPPCHGDGASTLGHGTSDAQAPAVAIGLGMDHPAHADKTSDHTSCSSCDICHGGVLIGAGVCSGAHAPQTGRPACTGAHFASAVLPGQHKPPIA